MDGRRESFRGRGREREREKGFACDCATAVLEFGGRLDKWVAGVGEGFGLECRVARHVDKSLKIRGFWRHEL